MNLIFKISKPAVYYRLKSEQLSQYSNAVKPYLNNVNKIARLKYSLLMLEPKSIIDRRHLWTYITKTPSTYEGILLYFGEGLNRNSNHINHQNPIIVVCLIKR